MEEVRPRVRYTDGPNGAVLVHMDGTPFAPNEVGTGGGASSDEARLLRHLEMASLEDADRFRSGKSPLSVQNPAYRQGYDNPTDVNWAASRTKATGNS